ncbi:hypothetical protein [Catellatospora chokoriensis]|uniref:Uncharacterized protein n=1 Tax=Catellatospora chokoriensis TaxID=310353 RepID=A0A8J3NSQ1_9ACTN|nr:hypothetical protein [Catellatospora chokoriensis]GIF90851.1 hypothetical protein Cch02nite_42950 [Catellatospora chokoriensis]
MTPSSTDDLGPHRSGSPPSVGDLDRLRRGRPAPSGDPHRRHAGTVGLDQHRRVLAAVRGDAQEIVGALAELRDLRAAIDDAERDLLAAARRKGVSWGRVAAALGLRSRQAAEQRAARLAEQAAATDHHDCQHCVDTEPVAALRAAARSAAEQMAADPSWDGTRPRAALARTGLTEAADAPAGALYSLVEHAVEDLATVDLDGRPVLLRVAVTELRRAYREATPGAAAGNRAR